MTKFVTKVQAAMAARKGDDTGASMVEYGLLVGLIAVVCIAAVTATGTSIQGLFNTVAGAI